ncbi:transposase [Micromonospora echinofusca]|uniref:transposase n=1 Tax=Micromonospora echinofusca TaxID=47858 RepID=UPI001FCD46E4|nr:transposase [Micromonospora echinofusca]
MSRATHTRDQGVRHMIAALDLTTGKLHYHIRDRKRWREFPAFLKVRRRWPDQTLYLILENFSSHKHPEVRAWCAANPVELVYLPTYASWLNWIEAEFAAVR